MKKEIRLCVILIFLSYSTHLWATNEGAGDPWAFMTIGTGARATGFGSAFVAIADDATATDWNPPGIGFLKCSEATLMSVGSDEKSSDETANGIAGSQTYLSGVWKTATYGSLGASFNQFSIDNIQYTRRISDPVYEEIGKGSDTERAWTVSYAYPFSLPKDNPWFSLGISARYMTQQFFGFKTGKLGLDVGYLMKMGRWGPFNQIRWGGVFQFNPKRSWEATDDREGLLIPANETTKPDDEPSFPGWRWGLALEPVATDQTTWTVALALVNRRKGSPLFLAVGTEIWLFNHTLALRAGLDDIRLYKRNATVEGKNRWALGFGINAPKPLSFLQFDFSLSDEELVTKYRVSLTLKR